MPAPISAGRSILLIIHWFGWFGLLYIQYVYTVVYCYCKEFACLLLLAAPQKLLDKLIIKIPSVEVDLDSLLRICPKHPSNRGGRNLAE